MVFVNNVMAQDENPFAGGTGTPDDPYLVETPAQFDRIRDDRGATYKLIADLDFSDANFGYEGGWWPIGEWGSGSGAKERFHGTFDGDGHTIKNFYVEKPTGAHDMTFFGVVEDATIENVLFENITFIGEGRMGLISGQTEKTIIRQVGVINCTVKNIGTGVEAGGFVGPGSQVQIYDCYFVDGSVYCNGKVGDDFKGDNAGALIGKAENMTAIMSSYVSGTIEGFNNIGGIAGIMDASSSISGCLSICDILGKSDAPGLGRICGGGSPDLSSGNFALETVKINNALVTTDNNADQRNGADVTEADLTQEFFEELGFDFDDTWKIDLAISPYPVFQWQKTGGGSSVKTIDNTVYNVYATANGVNINGLKGGETVCVYSIAGVLLEKKVAKQGLEEISFNGNGTYIVNIISDEMANSFKVSK